MATRTMSGVLQVLDEEEQAHSPSAFTQLVTLNLRGTKFVLPIDCAAGWPQSRLHKALRGTLSPPALRDNAGNSYFNRTPVVFHNVLDYMLLVETGVGGRLSVDEFTHRELLYWGITRKRVRTQEEMAAASACEMPAPSVPPGGFGKLQVLMPGDEEV